MPYVTTFEVMAKEEGVELGVQQGLRQSILDLLEIRFGPGGLSAAAAIEALTDVSLLRDLHRKAAQSVSLEEFRSALPGS